MSLCVCVCDGCFVLEYIFFFGHFFYAPFSLIFIFIKCHQMLRSSSPNNINNLDIFLIFDTKKLDDDDDISL